MSARRILEVIRPGQQWRSKEGGYVVTVTEKSGGMGHWKVKRGPTSHHVHEGTLRKFYEKVRS